MISPKQHSMIKIRVTYNIRKICWKTINRKSIKNKGYLWQINMRLQRKINK